MKRFTISFFVALCVLVGVFAGAPGVGATTTTGTRPLLVVVASFTDSVNDGFVGGWDRGFARERFFGDTPASVNGYMRAASLGRFRYTPAPEAHGEPNDGVVELAFDGTAAQFGAHQQAAVAALRATQDVVDYAAFDANGNGALDSVELTIVVVGLGGDRAGNGSARPIAGYDPSFSAVDGVGIGADFKVATINAYTNAITTIHELFHATFDAVDAYEWGVGLLDIMGPTSGVADSMRWLPGAATRMALGWAAPRVLTEDTEIVLRDATTGDAAVVTDPATGAKFVFEYRAGTGLDRDASAKGLVIWRLDSTADRWAELITPNVLLSDRRVAGCAGGCRAGDASDAFAPLGLPIPLRAAGANDRYSSGAFTGVLASAVSDDGALRVRVTFNQADTDVRVWRPAVPKRAVVTATTAVPETTTSTTEAPVTTTTSTTSTTAVEDLFDGVCG